MLSEEDIIKGCKQQNKAAQMALYKRYVGKMNALSYRYTNSYDDAKDIVQNGFIKIFSSIKNYKGDGALEGWIRRIIVNLSIDYLKKKNKHIFISINDSLPEEELYNDKDLLQSSMHDYEEDFLDNNSFSNEELINAINKLPEIYKIIFNMYCIEDYDHKEIAELLSIKEATSRSRLRKARILLAKYLEEVLKLKSQTGVFKTDTMSHGKN